MSEYELHSLIADLFGGMDSAVEFWISGTFAVVVARFIAGDALSRRTLWLVTLLYLAATGVSFGRFGILT